MRYSTAMIVAAIGIGEAVAGPTHAHLHRKVHEKKDVDWNALDWNAMGIDWTKAWAEGQASKTAAAASVATAASPAVAVVEASATAAASASSEATTSTSDVSDILGDVTDALSNDIADLFEGLLGASNSRTSFGESTSKGKGEAGDSYMGNYGYPYGSNIIKVNSADGYDFTATFHNTQSTGITVNIWNKVGPDHQTLSGSAMAPYNTTLTIYIPAGSSQMVAFMEDSQVAWSQACSEKAASGAYATTWGEANFLNAGSGYDMSAIMNQAGNNYNMKISSSEASCISDMTQNYWLTASEPIGDSDGSCYIAQSTAHLKVVMGGTV